MHTHACTLRDGGNKHLPMIVWGACAQQNIEGSWQDTNKLWLPEV